MRKLVAGLFMSLDGVVESPNLWQFDNFDKEMMEGMSAHMAKEDCVVLGRVVYQEWADYWPGSTDEPYASHINRIPKYVVSKTLQTVKWGSSDTVKLINKNHFDEIQKLKNQPGNVVGVNGPTLVRSVLEAGLLDELILMIHPVIAGKGKHLFKDGSPLKRMNLVNSTITSTGVAMLTFQPRK